MITYQTVKVFVLEKKKKKKKKRKKNVVKMRGYPCLVGL